jgi:glutathione S-transferase
LYGQDGKWLFSQFTIADAMFAPIAIRLHSVDYPLKDIEADYMETLYNNKHMQSWIKAGQQETEVITLFESSL